METEIQSYGQVTFREEEKVEIDDIDNITFRSADMIDEEQGDAG